MKKTLTRVLALLVAIAMVFAVAACTKKPGGNEETTGGETPTTPTVDAADLSWTGEDGNYKRAEDEDVYYAVLAEYEDLCSKAKAAETVDERFMLFAQAEAYLLDSAVMIPTTTQGGRYTISRVAPRTVPYVQWGNDDDRLKGLVISDEFLTPDEREDLLNEWKAAVAGEGTYDPAAYLTGKGHTIQTDYTLSFATAPVTIDWLNTSSQSDTEITVNTVDGLVEYDNLGNMQPALAESWEVSDDGLTYTFKIRQGVKWYTSEGTEYAELTAKDFVAGFRHMLDAKAGLEWLIDGVIAGGTAYYDEGGSWDDVGYKATDDYTLEITLEQPTSYFLTMLTYSCFLPICDSFFQAHGGVYGVDEFAAAAQDTNTYTYGNANDVASQVYCGPFLLQKLQSASEIQIVKNAGYYKADDVKLNSVKWVYDNNENPEASYNDAVNGVYAGISLLSSNGTLEKAKADGNFEKYAYISDTTSTTYFGGLNLNRGTFALESGTVASQKTEEQKIDTAEALINKNFRKAMMYAFDKATFNAVVFGDDLKNACLRNMYTHPEFVKLENAVTDADGHEFAAGTFYGDMVQYYCDQLDLGIKVADGVDGWYQPEKAVEYLNAAKEELGDTVTFPIQIDVVYYSAQESDTSQANAYKKVIEDTLGAENVVVNLVEATTSDDFYACGYHASNGEAGNFDMFYGSGWGPDYGDPSTYLDTFLGMGAGYMTKVIGLF